MSNILFKNPTFEGVLVKTTRIDTKYEAENNVTLSCGSHLQKIIRSMAEKNLGGMEGLYGIPGTVGGMIRQNAGAFGYEVSDRVISATCYLYDEKKVKVFSKSELDFSYRNSIFSHSKVILLNAKFNFVKKNKNDIWDEINSYSKRRLATQPLSERSLGSVFKRYNGVSAAYYIDRAGLKGLRIGGAEVSHKHAGFIVNTGGATASDYLELVKIVKHKVFCMFGIELEEEVEII